MKNLFFAIIVVSCILCACQNPLVSSPFIPQGDAARSRSSGAPGAITATQGGRRSIELRWDEVPGAVKYNIFKANSPLETFLPCAETTANQFKFTVTPGSTIYYKVSSVSQGGRESPQSIYVRGTSLAQPVITDIVDPTESGVTVTWYMDNATEDTYKNDLLYTVYCFDGSTEVAQLALDGAKLAENKAPFGSLKPNTRYEYQVEAYLRGDQSNSEKSDRVDAVTARRMRPAPPVNLRVARGTAVDEIDLFFELPDMVDIALGDNQYDPKPVYFVISKRQYTESGTNVYRSACSYFGSDTGNALLKGGSNFDTIYTPGTTVSWKDTNVSRGVKYEYQVQSYVDDPLKIISSDSSKASAVGWALSEGSLSFGNIIYTPHETASLYISAELPLVFDFDPKGETYDYVLVETIEPVDDGYQYDPDGAVSRISGALMYDDIKNYVAQMNLTQKTTENTPGRGVYSYEVEIKLNNETIDTVKTIGKIEVSENTEPIVVEGFSVQDGYTNKFVFKWHYHENLKYALFESDDRITWTQIAEVNSPPQNGSTVSNPDYSYPYTANNSIQPDLTKYFAIQPYRDIDGGKWGQKAYASTASRTLGVPELSLSGDGLSYSEITVAWTEAQKADTYRIQYWYVDEGIGAVKTAATIEKGVLSRDASERFIYSFNPFEYNTLSNTLSADAAKAGKEIQVVVDALNEELRAEIGGAEIATTSGETVQTQLVGPALLNPGATRAAKPTEIDVSWDKISGASGYYVFRRQFNMNNTAEEGVEAIAYYVPATLSPSNNITGKNLALNDENSKTDTTTVKAAASLSGSRYTLNDIYMPDSDYNSNTYSKHLPAYRDQQNNMAQGFSYRYYIVPVVNRGNFPEPLTSIEFVYAKDGSNKNTVISYYTIQESGKNVRYNGAAAFEKDGFTIGFGQNVTATKGTYTVQNSNANSGIQVTWTAPPLLAGAGITPTYEVYRKAYNVGTWDLITTVNTPVYIDSDASVTKGITYEYLIGISNGSFVSVPRDSARFIASCRAMKDENGRSNMLGYMLDMVKMDSVSRNERKVGNNFAEEVKWFGAGVKYTTDANNTNYRWGIDGYTVFVMNRNIDADWHEIADIPYANISNQTNQSVEVAANTKFSADGRDLLRVMRDYKHYFKVRSYVLNNGDKVYCPDPAWNYEVLFSQTANRNNQDRADFLQDDYVKWGARQITTLEFTKIATLFMAWGLHNAAGGSKGSWWDMTESWVTTSNNGSSGKAGEDHNGSTIWWFYFNQYKPDLDTRANKGNWTYSTTFVKIDADNGSIWSWRMIVGRTTTSYQYPHTYSRDGDYGRSYISIVGPSCVEPLYSGQLRFADGNLTWTGGSIDVIYPMGTSSVQITGGGQVNTPLPFQSQSEDRRTALDEWY